MSALTREDREAIERLGRAITQSGMSTRWYAEHVLVRDERTVRRWLAGENPIPRIVQEFLRRG